MRAILFAVLAVLMPAQLPAQPAASSEAITVEHYYKIKWGSAGQFKELYKRNHQPLLDEMKRQGFITAIATEEPFTHMAGDQRWDLRVRITYRDAPAAVLVGGTYDEAFEAAKAKLYPDEAKLDREEAQRFSLLDEHWDVIVTSSGS
jgi:hypothetical protein